MAIASDDFYERLGVPRTASADEIVRAHRRRLLEYPPEWALEHHRRIGEAFDTLSDPRTREAYDRGPAEPVARSLITGLQALAAGKYSAAESYLKLVLIECPALHWVRNLLGRALLYEEQTDAAAAEYEKLLAVKNPAAVWCANAAVAHRAAGRLHDAERVVMQAIMRAQERAADHYLDLADLLAQRGDFSTAKEAIREGIRTDDDVGLRDPRFPLKLVELAVRERDVEGLSREMERVALFARGDAAAETYAAWRLGDLARPVVDTCEFVFAAPLAEGALALAPSDAATAALAQITTLLRSHYYELALAVARGNPAFGSGGRWHDLEQVLETYCLEHRRSTPRAAEVASVLPAIHVPPRLRTVLYGRRGVGVLAAAVILTGAAFTFAAHRSRARTAPGAAPTVVPRHVARFAPRLERQRAPLGTPDSLLTPAAFQAWYTAEQERLSRMEQEIADLDQGIAADEAQLETLEREIKLRRDSLPAGPADYQLSALVTQHNRLVKLYNSALAQRKTSYAAYEQALAAANQRIDDYNATH